MTVHWSSIITGVWRPFARVKDVGFPRRLPWTLALAGSFGTMRNVVTDRQKAIIALVTTLLSWSVASIAVKYLIGQGYDPHTQNFYRYLAGTLAVLPFLVRRVRQKQMVIRGPLLAALLRPTLPNMAHQMCWTLGLLTIYPALAAFLSKSSVVFAAIMAFAFFPEERWLFRSWQFRVGLGLTLLGTVGLGLLRADRHMMEANLAVVLVLCAAAAWALYSISAKRLTAEVGPTITFGIVGIYTTIGLLIAALWWGDLKHWSTVPWRVNAIMIASGVICIGLAHTCYYYALRVLSVSVCATMLLTTPLGTMLISHWLFGETLTLAQVISGILLIAGGVLTLLTRQKQASDPVVRAVESADA